MQTFWYTVHTQVLFTVAQHAKLLCILTVTETSERGLTIR